MGFVRHWAERLHIPPGPLEQCWTAGIICPCHFKVVFSHKQWPVGPVGSYSIHSILHTLCTPFHCVLSYIDRHIILLFLLLVFIVVLLFLFMYLFINSFISPFDLAHHGRLGLNCCYCSFIKCRRSHSLQVKLLRGEKRWKKGKEREREVEPSSSKHWLTFQKTDIFCGQGIKRRRLLKPLCLCLWLLFIQRSSTCWCSVVSGDLCCLQPLRDLALAPALTRAEGRGRGHV